MIYYIIWIHFICDFILQTDNMAKNKSSHIGWLGWHIFIYTLYFNMFLAIALHTVDIKVLIYSIINGLSHFVIDFCTSKATRYLWEKKQTHNFFVVIGLDQALHMSILMYTMFILM